MAGTPATLRRTPLALATALVLVAGTLAIGMAGASATGAVRKYSPSLTPDTSCVAVGTVHRYTATITNSSSSNQPLGSALFHSNTTNGFYNIYSSSFTTPVVSNTAKTWQAIPDTVDADGVYLKAASSSSALAPGESVTMTFEAKAPSSTGNKTWQTFAWQGTNFFSSSFSLATGASNPKVTVSPTCVGPAANIAFFTGPSDTSAGGTMADVKVKVTDSSGNAVKNETVSLSSTGLVSAPTATTGNDGIATFTGAAQLQVGTTPGDYTMTASDGSLPTTPALPYTITPATAASITFTKQPTDTLKNTPIDSQEGGGVEVQVKDTYGNPVPGVTVDMAISPDSFAYTNDPAPILSDTTAPATDGSGKTSFTGLNIDLSSSGYRLRASIGSTVTQDSDIARFAITSTGSNCTDCTATLPNGGTVSAPDNTTLIVENNDVVDCGTFTGFAGTVTIIPEEGVGAINVTFDDPAGSPPGTEPFPQAGVTYPFCKGGTGGPTILDWGGTLSHPSTADRCSSTGNEPPCIVNQSFIVGELNLVTILRMDEFDPPVRH